MKTSKSGNSHCYEQKPQAYSSAEERLAISKRRATPIISALIRADLYSAANKISNCSSFPTISQCEQGHSRVKTAFRCRQRFCTICRSLLAARINRETTAAVELLQKEYPGLLLYFITFTTQLHPVEDVEQMITRLNKAFGNLLRRGQIAQSLLGSFKGIHFECHSEEGLVYVHIHALFAFKSSYRSRHYISKAQWVDLWRESFKDHSITQVDVQRVKPTSKHPTLAGAAGYLADYAVKSIKLDQAPPDFLKPLHSALQGRRLYSFTGELKKARPKKKPMGQPDQTCPSCSSSVLSESELHWNWKTEKYVERKQLTVSKSDPAHLKQSATNRRKLTPHPVLSP